jgi:ribosomal protein L5
MAIQPQPSAQGIASLYQGNPGALQQKIQQEQQAKPGMPQDLSKLMALNIVTNEADAAKRQEAMNQLQQLMGQQPPAGGSAEKDKSTPGRSSSRTITDTVVGEW